MTMTAADIVARAGAQMSAGNPARAVDLLTPLWNANPGHGKLRELLASAQQAAARQCYERGELDAAAARLDAALRIAPDNPALHGHMAIVQLRAGAPRAAEHLFETALRLADDPGGPAGWLWIQAAALARQGGRIERARDLIAARRAATDDDPEAAYAAAFVDLADGDLAAGWSAYEARWRVPGFASPAKPTQRPPWDGAPFPGRLLVWREQGVGDEIMFYRHLEAAASRCDALVVEADPRLTGLLRRSFPALTAHASAVDLTPNQVPDSDFDRHVPLASLPGRIADGAVYPAAGAYLRADPTARDRWRRELRAIHPGKRLIGLAWRSKNAEHGRTRSPDLALWRDILDVPDIGFVALQYDGTEAETRRHAITKPDLDTWQDLDGLAALMSALDGVVSIDNSTAHLAGALGVPTDVVLPYYCDWRWQMPVAGGGALYHRMRLHRQEHAGDWHDPMRRIAAGLAARD